ncbi:MAG: hypothetical protein EF806_03345 [Candidatus Methanoliparum thermophilum]|uniref:Tyr recombinase domain-containing protein n=1 Tax=Methanoliparum thermophilum TaxID=2491083 RepID=A0A520KT53_METT2|nr:tyrosine-type recombinase/integrase [Candidatus Methanoliparum sp. LAM-1]RZN65091.1 MAG: hypothetical protein EF806_03345 [Candidatus Methanoliparum thermophilum]BDC36016.1 hypothetical protein MTLP_06980 [Candidatus Methanoliparum sp. LAM-1]
MKYRLPSYLNENEVETILKHAENNERNYLILLLMWRCGLRVSEVCSLKERNIFWDDSIIKIEQSKGNKDRYVPITEDLLNRIKKYLIDKKTRSDYIFNITRVRIFQIVKMYAKKSGLDYKNIHPHTFRHSFAVYFLKRGGNLRALQKILGHSDLATTQKYLDLTLSDIKEEYYMVWDR